MRNETAGGRGGAAQVQRAERGSVVLFMLFVCLAVALCVQIICVVLMCGEQALAEETRGRKLAKARDEEMGFLRTQALAVWEPRPWFEVRSGGTKASGRLVELEDGQGWVLGADVLQDEAVTTLGSSAWLERGRDGVDLPHAALVAGRVYVSAERVLPWLTSGEAVEQAGVPAEATSEPVAYVRQAPESPGIGGGCRLTGLAEDWALGEGWEGLTDGHWRLCAGVFVLAGAARQRVCLPQDLPGSTIDSPVLVMVTGGADLDARGAGHLYGVLVVDRGSLLLEGTIVHGAVIATGDVDFGLTGQVESCTGVLQWATDRCLERVRAVPGTRREGTE